MDQPDDATHFLEVCGRKVWVKNTKTEDNGYTIGRLWSFPNNRWALRRTWISHNAKLVRIEQ